MSRAKQALTPPWAPNALGITAWLESSPKDALNSVIWYSHSYSGNETEAFPAGDPLPDQTGLTWADYSNTLVMREDMIIVFKIMMSTVFDAETWFCLCIVTVNIEKPSGANKSWSKINPSGSIDSSSTSQLSAHHICTVQEPEISIHRAPYSLTLHFHSPLTAVASILQPQLQSCKRDRDTRHRTQERF